MSTLTDLIHLEHSDASFLLQPQPPERGKLVNHTVSKKPIIPTKWKVAIVGSILVSLGLLTCVILAYTGHFVPLAECDIALLVLKAVSGVMIACQLLSIPVLVCYCKHTNTLRGAQVKKGPKADT